MYRATIQRTGLIPLISFVATTALIAIGLYASIAGYGNLDEKDILEFRTGDIIFQESQSSQSLAIQAATGSRYSHMGILYESEDGSFYVYEAVQPVKLTPVTDWIERGTNQHFVVMRLKGADTLLTASSISRLKSVGERFMNKDYDLYFEWSDERIYCSELVWKMYDEAFDIQIGERQRLREFDLTNPIVKSKLQERYGSEVPLDEWVISPRSMFESSRLTTIYTSEN